MRVASVVVAALLLTSIGVACSPGDESAVCEESADDLERLAANAAAEAGTATPEQLGQDEVDAMLSDLSTETYALDVHRDQLGCDRDELEDLLCPELFALAPQGPVATDLVDTMLRTYDCED